MNFPKLERIAAWVRTHDVPLLSVEVQPDGVHLAAWSGGPDDDLETLVVTTWQGARSFLGY